MQIDMQKKILEKSNFECVLMIFQKWRVWGSKKFLKNLYLFSVQFIPDFKAW